MATVIGLVGKLPAATVQSHPRLQLALAWANILLHRSKQCEQALALVDSALDDSGLSEDAIADLRIEADAVRSLVALRADRIDAIDQLVAPCLARAARLRPFVVGVAANIATFVAAYRGDLDEVHRLQGWAAQYFQRNIGKHNVILGLCFTGLAARMQLDLVEAETCYRKALKIAKRSGGSHSHTARLASSLLGELLYERGDLDEAERLLDEGYKLGPEGGAGRFQDRPLRDRRTDKGAPGRSACRDPKTQRGRANRPGDVAAAARRTRRKRADPVGPSGASGTRRAANDALQCAAARPWT